MKKLFALVIALLMCLSLAACGNDDPGDVVYGSLTLSPEQSQAHISDIVSVMKLLSENITDETAYAQMLQLRNALEHG